MKLCVPASKKVPTITHNIHLEHKKVTIMGKQKLLSLYKNQACSAGYINGNMNKCNMLKKLYM
jgi:hypothetical protein